GFGKSILDPAFGSLVGYEGLLCRRRLVCPLRGLRVRLGRSAGNLRGGAAPGHALRCGEERGAASRRTRVPYARSGSATAHPADQRDPWPPSGVWLGGAARDCTYDDAG